MFHPLRSARPLGRAVVEAARKAGDLFHSSSPAYEPSFSDFGKAASSGLAVGSFVGFALHMLGWAFTILASWFPSPITWALFSALAWLCIHAAALFVSTGSRAITPAQYEGAALEHREAQVVAAEQATLVPPP